MYAATLLIGVLVGYLAGSINFAIPLSRWARGIDIRNAGSKNPGTANVGREVGRGWAVLVLMGDLAKGLIPLFLAKIFMFPEDHFADYLALFMIGMSSITGHCWPVFYRFRGGGGLATSIGIYMFFIPLEFLTVLLVSFLSVQIFFRRKRYAYGQLVPMLFIPLAPVVTLICDLFLDMKLLGSIQIGGHSWYVTGGISLLSFYIVMINIRIVRARLSPGHSKTKS